METRRRPEQTRGDGLSDQARRPDEGVRESPTAPTRPKIGYISAIKAPISIYIDPLALAKMRGKSTPIAYRRPTAGAGSDLYIKTGLPLSIALSVLLTVCLAASTTPQSCTSTPTPQVRRRVWGVWRTHTGPAGVRCGVCAGVFRTRGGRTRWP